MVSPALRSTLQRHLVPTMIPLDRFLIWLNSLGGAPCGTVSDGDDCVLARYMRSPHGGAEPHARVTHTHVQLPAGERPLPGWAADLVSRIDDLRIEDDEAGTWEDAAPIQITVEVYPDDVVDALVQGGHIPQPFYHGHDFP